MKKLLLASLLTVASGSAFAKAGVAGSVDNVPAQGEEAGSGWSVQLGLGVVSAPEFAGSDETETTAVPLINVSYNNWAYFEYNKLGAWLWQPDDTGLRLGVVATPKKGYDKGDGPFPGHEVDDQTLAGLRVNWKSGMFALDAQVLGSAEEDSGGEVRVQGTYTWVLSEKATLTALVKVEAVSEDAVDYYYYGGNVQDNTYTPDAANNVSFGVIGTYAIAPKWTLLGAVLNTSYDDSITDVQKFSGNAEDSGTTAFVGATYKF
ncbi:MipA/OmpV family protein [Thalassotalea crassostreae]|uniref:MipA/OmpV family protein n=1 Tax=Thalassotalea crassostreae TaxID=1763536 RepID=UPI000838D235|nr:MipA/OmpV family protein [Thalassotalea crassostreae]